MSSKEQQLKAKYDRAIVAAHKALDKLDAAREDHDAKFTKAIKALADYNKERKF